MRITADSRKSKYIEKCGINVRYIPLIDVFISFFYKLASIAVIDPCVFLYFGVIFPERCTHHVGSYWQVHIISAETNVRIDSVYLVCMLIKPVVAQFIHYIEGDQQKTRQAYSQPRNINDGEGFVFPQIPQRNFQVIFKHKFYFR